MKGAKVWDTGARGYDVGHAGRIGEQLVTSVSEVRDRFHERHCLQDSCHPIVLNTKPPQPATSLEYTRSPARLAKLHFWVRVSTALGDSCYLVSCFCLKTQVRGYLEGRRT